MEDRATDVPGAAGSLALHGGGDPVRPQAPWLREVWERRGGGSLGVWGFGGGGGGSFFWKPVPRCEVQGQGGRENCGGLLSRDMERPRLAVKSASLAGKPQGRFLIGRLLALSAMYFPKGHLSFSRKFKQFNSLGRSSMFTRYPISSALLPSFFGWQGSPTKIHVLPKHGVPTDSTRSTGGPSLNKLPGSRVPDEFEGMEYELTKCLTGQRLPESRNFMLVGKTILVEGGHHALLLRRPHFNRKNIRTHS